MFNHYCGHAQYLNYIGVKTFIQCITERLPEHRNRLEKLAATHELDWRLLAVVSYQESLWNVAAEPPTGVRGLMMLTMGTGGELGIEDQSGPEQSVTGGTEYFALNKGKIPERVPKPDHTWLALVGL
jgi:membrane-bound lytic murein transglycosylase F